MRIQYKIHILLLTWVLFSPFSVMAAIQYPEAIENPVVVRSFDPVKLNSLKNDSQFDYRTDFQERSVPIWQKIILWLSQYLDWIFRKLFNINAPAITQWIFLIAIAIFGGWVVLKLIDINIKDSFFKSNDSGNLNLKIEEENIHELDFNQLVAESIKRLEYRMAIRYLYLFALKKLSDRNLIEWVPGKTNLEYERELSEEQVVSSFARLGYYFENAWYGDFDITSDNFERARNIFDDLNRSLLK